MLTRWLAKVYIATARVFRGLHAGVLSVFEGVWMGVLPDSAIDQISELSYRGGWPYNSPGYLNSGLQVWEQLAVERYFPPGTSVLVAAAGAGREMIALARAGYSADGFDCNRALVSAGQLALTERNLAGTLDWAPPCGIPTISTIYGAAIIGWNGYTHIAPRARRVAFLKSLAPHLLEGAPVLVSVAVNVNQGRSWELTWKIANAVRRLTLRRADIDDGATFPGRPKHFFRKRQLEAELNEAGFTMVDWWTWGVSGAAVCRRVQAPPIPGNP